MMRGSCLRVLKNVSGGVRTIQTVTFPSFSAPTTASVSCYDSSTEERIYYSTSSSPILASRFAHNPAIHERPPLYQKRWRHAGKMGHDVESLKEMAHRPEREAAQERRKKKKERKVTKKGGGKQQKSASNDTAAETVDDAVDGNDDEDDDLNFDDLDNDDDDEDLDEDGEPTLPDPEAVRNKMDAVIERFRDSLKSIRGAEPTADMFDDVTVQAYGASTPLNSVAQVVISSPTLAQVTCFDPSVAKDVVKAIQLTLELNPQLQEGGAGDIRVPLPRVSTEVRERLSRSVKKRAESCKQRLRGIRRKAMDVVKKGKDGKLSGVSKDDAFASGKDIEAASEAASEKLKSIVDEKMDSIMAV